MLDALARHLEDDYAVWHNIPIMGSGREPDFVILHPRRGLLVLEVKDWKRQTIVDANPMLVQLRTDAGPVHSTHPVAQAREYVLDLMHQVQKIPHLVQAQGRHLGKPVLPFGWGAVLSHIKRADVGDDPSFAGVFEPHKVLLADDLAEGEDAMAFQQKLWGMFAVGWEAQLTLPQMNMLRGLLFPELRMGIQQQLPLVPSPSKLVVQDLLQVMDMQQEAVARGLGEGHRVIHGPAGSGKTMILIFRAAQLQAIAREDKPVLVLCFNSALAERIGFMLRMKGVGPNVQVSTFHKWALDLIRTYQLAPIRSMRNSEDFDAMAAIACEGITSARVPKGQYGAILIDEAHDLADTWLAATAQMVDPATKSLLVLYDDAQSIYRKSRRKLSFARLGIEAVGRTEILKVNYRNTTEVLALAMECAGGLLQSNSEAGADTVPLVMPQSAGRSGPMPTFHSFGNGNTEAAHIAAAVAEEIAAGRSPHDIAVLAPRHHCLETIEASLRAKAIPVRPSRGPAPDGPAIRLSTLHSSKGLEFPVVHVAALDRLSDAPDRREEELRLLYVGMTRATHRLHLSSVGSTSLVDHVARSVDRVSRAAS